MATHGEKAGASSPGPTSLTLLDRIRANDQSAWVRLVDLYGPLVYAWCRQAGLKEDDRADVFQEVFLAVSRHGARFRKEKPGDSFRGWLRIITRNKINDQFRRGQGQPDAAGGSAARERLLQVPGPAEEESAKGADELWHRALEQIRRHFDDRTWQAFWCVTVEGRTSTEAAAALGLTANAVRKAKVRVLQRLRQEFGDLLS